MIKLDELIELNYLEKQNRKNRLEDKIKKTRILWRNRRVISSFN